MAALEITGRDCSVDNRWRQIFERYQHRQKKLPPPNRFDKFAGDPIGFITEGLHQCVDDSWRSWRIVLKAAFGKTLDADELEFFKTVAGGRDPPPGRVRELWLIIGRRGGKDSMASMFGVEAARYCDTSDLRPGETALVACLATDRTQAGIVHRYIRGYFESEPDLRAWVDGDLSENTHAPIRLINRTEITVATNNFRATRGYPLACVIFDEVAFWNDEGSANPDIETYRAIEPGMMTIANSMLIGITSAYRKKGLAYDKWKEHFGKDDPEILVIQAATREFNPTIPQSRIDLALKRDPEAAAAEWLAQFREDLADYVDREVVMKTVAPGIFERPPERGVNYEAFIDPSGGSRDSFTLAIGHRDRTSGRGILDLLRERRPPFQPSEVVEDFSLDMKRYHVTKARGDRYAGEWPVEQFKKHQINYEQSAARKSDIYRDLLPLLNSTQVELLDIPRLVGQFCGLERRTVRGGRDIIDHPNVPDAHDDLCNSAAGVLLGLVKPDEVTRWQKAYG